MKKKVLTFLLALCLAAGLFVDVAPKATAHDIGKAGQATTVSAGSDHTAAITTDGTLWVW